MQADVQPGLCERDHFCGGKSIKAATSALGYVTAQALHGGVFCPAVCTFGLSIQAVSGSVERDASQFVIMLQVGCQLGCISKRLQANVTSDNSLRWATLNGMQSSTVENEYSYLGPDWALVLFEVSSAMRAWALRAMDVCKHPRFLWHKIPVSSMFSSVMQVDVLRSIQVLPTDTAIAGEISTRLMFSLKCIKGIIGNDLK